MVSVAGSRRVGALVQGALGCVMGIFSFLPSQEAGAISFDKLTGSQNSTASFAENPLVTTVLTTPSALGGVRQITAQAVSGGFLYATVGGGFLDHSQGALTRGSSLYVYDGNPIPGVQPTGLGGIDLTKDGGTAIKIKVESFDYANDRPLSIRFTIYDASDPTGTQKVSVGTIVLNHIIEDPAEIVLLPFSNFVAAPGAQPASFTNVGAITVVVDGSTSSAYDLTLSFLGTNGNCDHVPVNGLVLDQCGVCNGDNSTCSDCKNVPNGTNLPGAYCPTGVPGICADGTWTGTPPKSCQCTQDKPKGVEVCDALDNDCDGEIDEGFQLGTSCSVGVGACKRDGVKVCAADKTAGCSVTPGNPSTEICDEIDNNCNGQVDENLGKGDSCSVGVGACSATGTKICGPGGTVICSASPKTGSREVCDGLDNDCNGVIDDGLGKGDACSVGVGACANTGVKTCGSNGAVVCSASPKAATTEVCDGIDNDCDGVVDNVFGKGDECSVGVGACQAKGIKVCGGNGALVCTASPKAAASELCDGVDNDCDGSVDEDTGKGDACTVGVGACQNSGVKICSSNGGTECSVSPKATSQEICDGIDNDCNGQIDDGAPVKGPMTDACGVCGGDGTSCLQCGSVDMSSTLEALDGGAKEQQLIVRQAVGRLRSLPRARSQAVFISKTLATAQKLQLRNWILSWQLPRLTTTCNTSATCVTTNNVSILTEYRQHNEELRQLAYSVVAKIKTVGRLKTLRRQETSLLKAADRQFTANDKLSRTVPDTQMSCS